VQLEDKKYRNYLTSAVTSALWIFFIKLFWPDVIPFGAWDFWKGHGNVGTWLAAGWPAFVWGGAVTTVFVIFRDRLFVRHPLSGFGLFITGLFKAAWAGVAEEICFRWLIFLGSIASVKITNFLIFGFLGFGIPSWLFRNLVGPVADFFTLHDLHEYLFSPAGWAVGAALLSTNAFFRDGHKYLGWIGYVNSWFIGMFLFWIMFHYGLLAAITVHFVYDVIVFTIVAIGVTARGGR
jgi:hypothetical protein